jgi:hypothetical protein
MSHGNRNSKRKGRTKAATLVGIAGALSLAGGACGAAVGPPSDAVSTAVLTMRDAAPLLSAALVCSSRHRHAPKEMAPTVCGLAGATLVARMMRCPRHSVRLNGLGWARPQRGPESLAARVRFGRA